MKRIKTDSTHNSVTSADILADFQTLSKRSARPELCRRVQSVQQSVKSVLFHFRKWLKSKKLSDVSCKNYISDTRTFLTDLGHLPHEVEHFTNYSLKLQNASTPRSTINRKLTSLRHFARFLHQIFALPNFESDISNIPQDPIENLLKNFRYHLTRKGHKSKTITNYLSDIKHYLIWATEAENT